MHPFPAYVVVLGTATALGGSVTGFALLVPNSLAQAFVASAIGVIAGVVSVYLNAGVLRGWSKLNRAVQRSRTPVNLGNTAPDQPQFLLADTWGLPLVRRNWLRWALSAANARWSLGRLTVLAVLEEWVFRGVLVALCLRLPPVGMALGLFAVTLAFGVSHSYAGWGEAVAKSIVGGALLGTALTAGTSAAVVAHILFNTTAWWSSFKAVSSRAAS